MKKLVQLLSILLFALSFTACQRLRIELSSLPPNTPEGAAVYVAGNFNNWNPADPDYKMQLDPVTQVWFTNIPFGFGTVCYKFTRGDWTSVETDSCGGDTDNRTALASEENTATQWVSGWRDLSPVYCNRLTLVLDSIPPNTPTNSAIYLSGNINYWMLGQPAYKFTKGPQGKYCLTVPRREDRLIFKLNRGTWESIEADPNNREIESREIVFGDKDSVHISMRHWIDLPYQKSITKTLLIAKLPSMQQLPKIYLSGSFNNWHPKDESFTFKKNAKGLYYINYTFSDKEAIYYKLTLGGWENREIKANGAEMNNRLLLKTDADTQYINIGRWAVKPPSITNLEGIEFYLDKTIEGIALPPVPSKPENTSKPPLRKIFFIIDKMPELRQKDDGIFLAGDFNEWQTDLPNYEFKTLKNGKKFFVLKLYDTKDHYFKISRGDWSKEEADVYRNKMGNKRIQAGQEDDTLHLSILNWTDYLPAKKLTILLTALPKNTPTGAAIYLTGDFNGWQPASENYRFKNQNGQLLLHIPYFTEEYGEFKITRGDWSNEFSSAHGRVLANQAFRRNLSKDTLYIRVDGWKDLSR
jgi:hypothetical protein